jgi:hypothetical protein
MRYLLTISGLVGVGYLGGLANALIVPTARNLAISGKPLVSITDMAPQTPDSVAIMILGVGLIAISSLLKSLGSK